MTVSLKLVHGARGSTYYAVGSINGVRINRSTGFGPADKKSAKIVMKQIIEQTEDRSRKKRLTSNDNTDRSMHFTVGQARDQYLKRPGGIGDTTSSYVDKFADKHKSDPIGGIMPIDVLNFVHNPSKSGSTIRREINAIQGFLNYVRESFDLPPLRIRKPENNAPKNTRFTSAQRDHMLLTCTSIQPWFVPHLTFMFYTGCRRSELCKLRWADILFDGLDPAVILLRSKKGRHGRLVTRRIPVHPILGPLLSAMRTLRRPQPEHRVFLSCTGQPIDTPTGINKAFDSVAKVAGLSHLTPHDVRRTFASELLEHEVSDLLITDMLGHIDKKMLSTYAVASDEIRRHAVQKISSPSGA